MTAITDRVSDQIRRNDMTAIDRLNQIEAIANAATEGPWSWACRTSADGDHWVVYKEDTAHALASNRDGWGPDAEFIAAARTDVPWLIGQVRFLLGELAAAVADNEKKDAALRAVLDLHRETVEWKAEDGSWYFSGCEQECTDAEGFNDYPCPTVRAIEEALS